MRSEARSPKPTFPAMTLPREHPNASASPAPDKRNAQGDSGVKDTRRLALTQSQTYSSNQLLGDARPGLTGKRASSCFSCVFTHHPPPLQLFVQELL